MEPPRPAPPMSWRDRVGRIARSFSLPKLMVAAVSVVVIAVGGWWLVKAPPMPIEQQLPRASSGSPSLTTTHQGAPGATASELVVQIAGAVKAPGVYRLPAGSRVTDLVEVAGGPIDGADQHQLPLAQKLTDGQRIVLARPGEAVVGVGPMGNAAGPSAPLNLNSATAQQLETLPGIGPATAAAIITYRNQKGPLRSVDDLLNVRGIGPAKLDAFRELVAV